MTMDRHLKSPRKFLYNTMARDHRAKKKRIAIVGAGCSGLAAIKCCLEEGLEPVCLEKSAEIGGLWNFSSHVTEGDASIYSSLVINTSKYMMMFSDFPPPDNFPPFLTHSKVLDYFRMYAQHFRLTGHIRFNTEVCQVTKSTNYEADGKWDVKFVRSFLEKRMENGDSCCQDTDVVSETFDGVMICTGHHSVPYMPDIPGLAMFQGTVLHSHAYKDASPFEGKRVVILGLGNSAVDIACDLAKSAKEVYISSRRGAWIVPRTAFWGLPADMLANSRVVFSLPYRLLDWCVQLQANFRIDHVTYGLKPGHGVLNCHPTINDELPIHLVSGRVQTRPNIRSVDSNSVQFDDLTVCPCDVIILATGYEYRLDTVDEAVFKVENNRSQLYQYVFPPHLPHPTLAVIGLVQAIGAAMPISEMQSRWFARIMAGDVRLPSRKLMENDINKKKAAMSDLYVRSKRHTLQTFWIDYMDQVASQIGVRPCLWKIMCSDPELAIKCYMGPCLPAQYRLVGPCAWTGARAFIVSALSRVTRSRSLCNVSKCNVTSPPENSTVRKDGPHSGEMVACSNAKPRETIAVQVDCSTGHRVEVVALKCGTVSRANPGTNHTPEQRTSRGKQSPEWRTLAFYTMMMVVCLFAWLLSVLYDQAESLLNAVDKQLPLTD